MSSIMNKNENELIRKRRRRKRIKKTILLFIFMISTAITLCFKLPYFNIKNVKIVGNKNVSVKDITDLSKVSLGNNIFYINLGKSKNSIESNPYIEIVDIKRKYPSTIEISVKERETVFYGLKDNKYYVIDKNGILIQKRNDINNMKLTKLDGFDFEKGELGKVLPGDDSRKVDAVKAFAGIIQTNKEVCNITSIDLSNSVDIKVYCGEMCIKFGSGEEVQNKLNKAVNMLQRNEFKSAKGYIDVSFDGNPVFFIQK